MSLGELDPRFGARNSLELKIWLKRMPKQWRNAAWLMMGNGIRLGISGIYFVGLARWLGPETFGLFSGILACGVLASPWACWGQPDLLSQHLSRDPLDQAGRWRRGLGIATLMGLGLTLGLWIPLTIWLPGADPGAVGLLLLAEVGLTSLQHVQKGALVGLERIPTVAVIDTGMAAGRLGILGIAWLLGWRSLGLWSLLYCGMASIAVGVTAIALRQTSRQDSFSVLPQEQTLKSWRQQMQEGWSFAVGMVAIRTFADLDRLLLPRLASATQGGIYSAAYRLINISQTPVIAWVTSSFADICRAGKAGIREAWGYSRRLWILTVGYGLVVSGGLVLGAPLLPWVLGAEYAETAIALRWLAAVAGLEGIHLLLSVVLLGAGQHQARGYWQGAAVLLNGVLNLIWIPSWGWRGAALATLISEILLVVGLGGLMAWGCWQQGLGAGTGHHH